MTATKKPLDSTEYRYETDVEPEVELRSMRAVVTVGAPPGAPEEAYDVPVHADLDDGVVVSERFPMRLCGTGDGLWWATRVVASAEIEFKEYLEDQGHDVEFSALAQLDQAGQRGDDE